MAPRSGFVNRTAEMSVLAGEADRVARGEPRVVYVSGPAGIGKTALVVTFLGKRFPQATVMAAGAEAEAGLHLGVAQALLRALGAHARLTVQPVTAQAEDPLACGAAIVELLGLAQRGDGVVAVIVDDVQWVDPASVAALTFALRRLNTDRVLAVLIGRDEVEPGTPLGRVVDGPRGSRLRVGGLDAAAVRDMASRVGPRALSAAQAGVLQAHTGGNPLYLRALLAELPAASAIGPDTLPAPETFAASALAPLARSPDAARRLVAAAAVLGMESRLADAARLAAVPAPLETAAAVPPELVKLADSAQGRMLRFTHPLNRAAAYHDLPHGERARLHGLAAEHTTGRQALWHRVRAAVQPVPALAAELMRTAADELSHGQYQLAAEDLAGAARVHPDPAVRQRLLLDAADLRLLGSDTAGAAALADLVPDRSGSRWHYVHGHQAAIAGRLAEARAELEVAWERIGPADDDLRGPIAALLAQIMIMDGCGRDGARWAERAVGALAAGHPLRSTSRACLALGLWTAGCPGEAMARLDGLPADPARAAEPDGVLLAVRGQLRLWDDDPAGARADCATAIRLGREAGLPRYVPFTTFYLAEAEYRLGEWDDAVVHGDLAVSLIEDTEQFWFTAGARGIAALVLAARGAWRAAEEHVAAAGEAAWRLGNQVSHSYAANAAAHLAFARRDWPAVIDAGTAMSALGSRGGTFEPGVLGWRELFGEALVATGRLEHARRDLAEAVEVARERGRRSVLARLSRPRAALALAEGDDGRARRVLEEGAEHAAACCGPFDQALVQDALGRLLRRQGERLQAATRLQAALDRYDRLAAAPFLGRCADELAACGLRPARRPPAPGGPPGLTPRELAVVRLASRGLTNRQIAVELVISVKTVEYHLGSVFAKVGVTTRTELAARLADDGKPREFPDANAVPGVLPSQA